MCYSLSNTVIVKKDYLGWQHETAVAVAAAHTEVLMNLTFFVLECVRAAEK